MNGFASKRRLANARHADETTVDHLIALTKERNALLDETIRLRQNADYWCGKCMEWMQRYADLHKELSALKYDRGE